MSLGACQWPDGCNRGAFRHVSMPGAGERFLCLHHAGAVWNLRKSVNRAAGLCPCGAAPTPGYRTCARCRARARQDRARARAVNARAAECGLTLPRANGRRRAFLTAYAEAFNRASRQARRRWRRTLARGSLRPVVAVAAVPWEGHVVTCRAELAIGGSHVRGVPADQPGRNEQR